MNTTDNEEHPKFEVKVYYGTDGTPVLEIGTEDLGENLNGPICRIWLNDETIWENPPVPNNIYGSPS